MFNLDVSTTTPSTTPKGPTTTTIPELWNKTCVEEGKYYDAVEGQSDKQIKNIKSWEHCAYLCKLDPECDGFTWAGPKYVEATRIFTCALKTELRKGKGEIVGLWRGTKECGDCKYCNIVKTLTQPTSLGFCQTSI